MNDDIIVYHDRLGYRIPSKFKDQFYYKEIKKKLTISIKDYYSKEIIKTPYYYETPKALLIPRLFPIEDYIQKGFIGEKEKYQAKKIKIKSKITPRNKIQTDSIDYLLHNPNVLLQLPPGSGKTVISIHVLCTLRFKTIIFVHRESLIEQWHDRIIEFTNAKESQIGYLSSNSYEDVLENSDIILSTVQSFNAILRNEKFKDRFLRFLYHSGIGLMIGDEVHTTVGAPMFSLASLLTPCHRTIGLSATPDRNDGAFKIMKYHLGEIYESPYASGTMDAEINVMLFDFELVENRQKWLFWDGQFQYSRYYQILRKSKIFRHVLHSVLQGLIDDNRHIVVMVERIKFIDELIKEFKDYDCVKFTAGVKNEILSHKIVLTTPGKMRDGVDAPWKDTIIFTSPVKNITQAIGRIIRTYENKQTPIVMDFVDTGIKNISNTFFRDRLPYYRKKNWTVNYYAIENGSFTKMGQDKAFRVSGLKK
jgi:superfamily II DNA or RNA helicase